MREPAAGLLTVTDEDEAPDEIEFDPRWEVQPAPDVDDGSSGGRPWTFIALVAVALVVAAFVWLLSTSPGI